MAQFRSTADILDSVLERAGEVTNGRSAYESRALEFCNRVHHVILAGGNEFNLECDETWPWARAQNPMVLELKPKYSTGTVTMTKGSNAGSFSAAPADSLQGWHIKIPGRDGIFKITSHAAGASSFDIDGFYDGDSGSLNFEAIKIDYELVPSHITINAYNKFIDFEETADVELTATLTEGSYTPSELATEVQSKLNAAGASVYTVTYNSGVKKFTLSSNLLGGGGTFKLMGLGTNQLNSALPSLGFDIIDIATSATHTSVYVLGGISRMVEPFKFYKRYDEDAGIYGVGSERFHRDYPLTQLTEGSPTRFCVRHETPDGIVTVRVNRYVREATRFEVDYVPVPLDLQDNAVSRPKVPRNFIDIIEYGAAAMLLFEKEDSKWEQYFNFADRKLQAAINQRRTQTAKTGKYFGQIIAREDLMPEKRRNRLYGYATEDY